MRGFNLDDIFEFFPVFLLYIWSFIYVIDQKIFSNNRHSITWCICEAPEETLESLQKVSGIALSEEQKLAALLSIKDLCNSNADALVVTVKLYNLWKDSPLLSEFAEHIKELLFVSYVQDSLIDD